VQVETTIQPQQRVTLTEKEFAAAVGLSVTTCWALRKQKKLPHFKVGRRIFYSREHITQFLASIEQDPKAA
jgi:predicted DNA-binding transcriptional regulator AlpA